MSATLNPPALELHFEISSLSAAYETPSPYETALLSDGIGLRKTKISDNDLKRHTTHIVIPDGCFLVDLSAPKDFPIPFFGSGNSENKALKDLKAILIKAGKTNHGLAVPAPLSSQNTPDTLAYRIMAIDRKGVPQRLASNDMIFLPKPAITPDAPEPQTAAL